MSDVFLYHCLPYSLETKSFIELEACHFGSADWATYLCPVVLGVQSWACSLCGSSGRDSNLGPPDCKAKTITLSTIFPALSNITLSIDTMNFCFKFILNITYSRAGHLEYLTSKCQTRAVNPHKHK